MDELTKTKLQKQINGGKAFELGHKLERLYYEFYGYGQVLSNSDIDLLTKYMRSNKFQSKPSLGCFAYIDHSEDLFNDWENETGENYVVVYNSWKDFIANCDDNYQEEMKIDCLCYDRNKPDFLDGDYYYITDKGWRLIKDYLIKLLGV